MPAAKPADGVRESAARGAEVPRGVGPRVCAPAFPAAGRTCCRLVAPPQAILIFFTRLGRLLRVIVLSERV